MLLDYAQSSVVLCSTNQESRVQSASVRFLRTTKAAQYQMYEHISRVHPLNSLMQNADALTGETHGKQHAKRHTRALGGATDMSFLSQACDKTHNVADTWLCSAAYFMHTAISRVASLKVCNSCLSSSCHSLSRTSHWCTV